MGKIFSVREYAGITTPPESLEDRCVRLVEKEQGVPLGKLIKLVGRKSGVTKEDALDAIQSAIDQERLVAEEETHQRTGKPFLRFWSSTTCTG